MVSAVDASRSQTAVGLCMMDRTVHYADVVPHLPPQILGFHHPGTEVWYQENNVDYQVCNGSGEDPACSDSLSLPDSVSDHFNYLGVDFNGAC